jgi:glycosyltransferase involved in cell wall biosynthesis
LDHHQYPVISLVHHLLCSELRPRWQNAFYRMVEERYLHSVDGFIFNSKTTQGVVNGLIGDRKPAIVAYPPTDRFGEVLPEAFVADRAAEPGPLRIVFLGNVIERKGLHTLVEAVSRQPLDIRLDVIGSLTADPAYALKMQQKASALGLSSMVNFHGPKDNSDLADMLLKAHVLAVPSSYEGFGMVYLEGMGFGLSAIGTTAGAAGEIISDGATGYLVLPDDAETLAARLQSLASDRDLLAKLSLNALKRYQQQPTWNETAGEIREFLKKQIENARLFTTA